MSHKSYPFLLLCMTFLFSCEIGSNDSKNPAAEGFNLQDSDPEAIVLADKVMAAMGGRDSWDDTKYIAWNFFGVRDLIWDKSSGDVRINIPEDELKIILNVNSMEGKVNKGGENIENTDSLSKYLEMGKNIWINDSYWLVMPFKLKDSGVTLQYLGEDVTNNSDSAAVLELTFENVGSTPENKYHVYIDKNTNLVTQWAYFAEASQDTPNFVMPWLDYEKHGEILLSGNRGERKLSEIKVLESVPDHTFKSFDPVDLGN